MSKKNEIKEQIAHLLMRSNVGLLENAIIQQVEATSNVNAITEALKNMKNVSEVMLDGKRWKITPVGRSIYSDLNNSDMPTKTYPLSAIAEEKDSGIEVVQMYSTPDGKLHKTPADAEHHMFKQHLHDDITKFMAEIGAEAKQRGLITSYISRWEKFRQEQAA
jgi:hypothetical protein